MSFVFLFGALKVLSPHVTCFSQSGKKYYEGEGYPTSIQLVAAWLDGWRGREITNQYLTGCWLGVCGGVPYQYPYVCCFGGWKGGILKISYWVLVGWGGWDPNNIQMFFRWVERG